MIITNFPTSGGGISQGINLLNNTRRLSDGYQAKNNGDTITQDNDGFEILKISSTGSTAMHLYFCTDMKANIKSNNEITSDIVPGYYTFSCELRTNIETVSGFQFRIYTNTGLFGTHVDITERLTTQNDEKWHKVKLYLNISDSINWVYENGVGCNDCKVGFGFVTNLNNSNYFEIKKAKLELGRVENPIWTPSPADISLIYDRLATVVPPKTISDPVADMEGPE